MKQGTFPVYHFKLTKTRPTWQLSAPSNFGSKS